MSTLPAALLDGPFDGLARQRQLLETANWFAWTSDRVRHARIAELATLLPPSERDCRLAHPTSARGDDSLAEVNDLFVYS